MRYVVTNEWAQGILNCQCEITPGKWVPARPVRGLDPLWTRVKWAWRVLTRKADIIEWPLDLDEWDYRVQLRLENGFLR